MTLRHFLGRLKPIVAVVVAVVAVVADDDSTFAERWNRNAGMATCGKKVSGLLVTPTDLTKSVCLFICLFVCLFVCLFGALIFFRSARVVVRVRVFVCGVLWWCVVRGVWCFPRAGRDRDRGRCARNSSKFLFMDIIVSYYVGFASVCDFVGVSQSVLLGFKSWFKSFFSISKFSNPFPFSTFHFELTYKQNCEQLFFWSTNSRY